MKDGANCVVDNDGLQEYRHWCGGFVPTDTSTEDVYLMPAVKFITRAEAPKAKRDHRRSSKMVAYDDAIAHMVLNGEDVLELTPGDGENVRGVKLSLKRAASRAKVEIKTWDAGTGIAYAVLKNAAAAADVENDGETPDGDSDDEDGDGDDKAESDDPDPATPAATIPSEPVVRGGRATVRGGRATVRGRGR